MRNGGKQLRIGYIISDLLIHPHLTYPSCFYASCHPVLIPSLALFPERQTYSLLDLSGLGLRTRLEFLLYRTFSFSLDGKLMIRHSEARGLLQLLLLVNVGALWVDSF
jgi:hypothetical protein